MLTGRHHTQRAAGRAKGTTTHFALFMVFLFFFAALPACSPRIIERVVVQRDTTTVHTRDTMFRKDSIYIREYMRGDTVYIDRYRDRYVYRDRWRDSVAVRVDSVAVETVKEVKVERRLTWWQRFRLWAFWWLLGAALLLAGWTFRKWI